MSGAHDKRRIHFFARPQEHSPEHSCAHDVGFPVLACHQQNNGFEPEFRVLI